jgi:hypothetical protein
MMHPFKSVQKLTPTSTLGYPLTETQEHEHLALNEAFDLVRKAKHLGLQTRLWVEEARRHTEQLLHWGSEEQAWRFWKEKVLSVPNAYLSEMDALIKKFEPLNPPLKTEHIRPFQEAIGMDRQITVEAISYVVALMNEQPPQISTTPPSLSI